MRSALLGVLGVALAMGSCDNSNGSGPLGELYGDLAVETCVPRRQGQAATFADVYVENQTDGALTLTGLSFAETAGVTLLGSVISSPDLPLVAAGRGYPPDSVPDNVWEQTRPVQGAAVGTKSQLISIGLRLDERAGEAKTVLLAYELDGTSHEVSIERTYQLKVRC
jgi:hypothetical protein